MPPKNENKEAELQQLYAQLQYMEEQSKQLEHESHAIEQKRAEFMKIIDQLESFKKSKKDAKVFSNIGAGIFAQGKIADISEFLVNVGDGNFVKKSVDEVKTNLKKQVEEFDTVQKQITQNLTLLGIQSQIIQGQMQKDLGVE